MPTAAAEPFGRLRDGAVYLPDAGALVVADLHLGKVAASAVEAPLDGGPAIVDRLEELVDRFEPATVVLAGDVLHAFGFVPRTARTTLASLDETVSASGASLVVLEGNHDAQLADLAGPEPIDAYEAADGTVICHGHVRPDATGRRYVVGHDHPAIVIEGRRRPCYLYGPGVDAGADVLALPAINPAVSGTTVNAWDNGEPLSPFLSTVSQFHPVVWDDGAAEPLVFPSLASLRPYL